MPEFIIRAEETDLFFLFKDYKELIRCKDCKYHNKYSECEIWELYETADTDYCSNGEKK